MCQSWVNCCLKFRLWSAGSSLFNYSEMIESGFFVYDLKFVLDYLMCFLSESMELLVVFQFCLLLFLCTEN